MKNSIFLASCLFSFTLIGQVKITANFPPSLKPGATQEVEVKINKGGITNFAKYQMDVPAGITVSEVSSRAGNFTFENNRAKIVWVSVPSDAEFAVRFKITIGNSAPAQANISQKFYYLDNGVKKEVEGDQVMMSISPDGSTGNVGAMTTAEAPVTPTKIEPVNPGTTSTTKTETKPATTAPANTTSQPATSTPASTTPASTTDADGFEYRIQIAASASDPGKAKYANLGSKLYIVKEDNMYKVQYGKYPSKEAAQQGKDEVQAKGYTPYLVKYKDGVRVK